MISYFSSPDSSLLLLTSVVALGSFLFLIIVVIVFSRSGYVSRKRREDVFHKLSNEYGLTMHTQKYSLNSAVVPSKLYPLQQIVGTVKGHTVCIEDLRSFRAGGTLCTALFFSEFSPIGNLWLVYQTEMTVDGLKHIIDNGGFFVPVYDGRAHYKKIKAALDQII